MLLKTIKLAGQLGCDSWQGKGKNIFLATTSRPALGPTHPPIQWVAGPPSTGVKWPQHEVDNPTPSNAEVKNAWSFTSISPYTFMVWC
jgi:hypothetical protein